MKRTLLVLGITLAAASPARADLTHKIHVINLNCRLVAR